MKAEPWRIDAACQGVDTELFYPTQGESVAEAKAICAVCPVREECKEFAFTNREKHGIWGGLSELERRRIRRKRRVATAADAATRGTRWMTGQEKLPPKHRDTCGSTAGHASHRYYGENPCRACLDAAARYKTSRAS